MSHQDTLPQLLVVDEFPHVIGHGDIVVLGVMERLPMVSEILHVAPIIIRHSSFILTNHARCESHSAIQVCRSGISDHVRELWRMNDVRHHRINQTLLILDTPANTPIVRLGAKQSMQEDDRLASKFLRFVWNDSKG